MGITGLRSLQNKLNAIAARARALDGKYLVVPAEQREAAKKAISAHILRGAPLSLPDGAELRDAPQSDSEEALADVDLTDA